MEEGLHVMPRESFFMDQTGRVEAIFDAAAKTQDAAAEVRIQNPEDRIIKE